MSDFLENEAEESSGSDSEAEHGSQKPTKKRAIIDSDDEEEGECLFKLKGFHLNFAPLRPLEDGRFFAKEHKHLGYFKTVISEF